MRCSTSLLIIAVCLLIACQATPEHDRSEYIADTFIKIDEQGSARREKSETNFENITHSLKNSLITLTSHIQSSLDHMKTILNSLNIEDLDGLAIDSVPNNESYTGDNSLLCQDSSIDTIFNLGLNTYVFKGDLYWKLSRNGVAHGYPKLIKNTWSEVETPVDAVYTARDTYKTYMFSNDTVWCYSRNKLQAGYPKLISEVFIGIPNNVDAVFPWGDNIKPYFFKGNKYWRHEPNTRIPGGKSSSATNISEWHGVPNNINAGLLYTNGQSFFFVGTDYYGYDDVEDKVAVVNPPYPRPTGPYWFGCGDLPADVQK